MSEVVAQEPSGERDPLLGDHPTALDAALAWMMSFAGERCALAQHGQDFCSLDGNYACPPCTARRIATAAAAQLKASRKLAATLHTTAVAKKYPAEVQKLSSALHLLIFGVAAADETKPAAGETKEPVGGPAAEP